VEVPTERLVFKKNLLHRVEESDAAFAERVAQSVQDQLAPVRDIALLAVGAVREKGEMQRTLEPYRQRSDLAQALEGLSPDQVAAVKTLAGRYRDKNQEDERQKREAARRNKGRRRGGL
jgi:hypothetical protein